MYTQGHTHPNSWEPPRPADNFFYLENSNNRYIFSHRVFTFFFLSPFFRWFLKIIAAGSSRSGVEPRSLHPASYSPIHPSQRDTRRKFNINPPQVFLYLFSISSLNLQKKKLTRRCYAPYCDLKQSHCQPCINLPFAVHKIPCPPKIWKTLKKKERLLILSFERRRQKQTSSLTPCHLYIIDYIYWFIQKKSRCFFKLNLHTIKSSSLFKNFVKKEAQLNYRMYDCFRNVVNPFLFLNFFLSPIFIPSIFFESSVRKLETGSLTTKRSSLSLIQIFF